MNPATTPRITGNTAIKNALSGDYDDAKQTTISSNSLWDEEE